MWKIFVSFLSFFFFIQPLCQVSTLHYSTLNFLPTQISSFRFIFLPFLKFNQIYTFDYVLESFSWYFRIEEKTKRWSIHSKEPDYSWVRQQITKTTLEDKLITVIRLKPPHFWVDHYQNEKNITS